jgi:hypothetical protein
LVWEGTDVAFVVRIRPGSIKRSTVTDCEKEKKEEIHPGKISSSATARR